MARVLMNGTRIWWVFGFGQWDYPQGGIDDLKSRWATLKEAKAASYDYFAHVINTQTGEMWRRHGESEWNQEALGE